MKWENTVLYFEISKGPNVIVDTLNTYGDDGWECCAMLSVALRSLNPIASLRQ